MGCDLVYFDLGYFCYFYMLGPFVFFRRVLGCFLCTNMYANCTYYNMTISRVGIEYPRLNFEHDGNTRECNNCRKPMFNEVGTPRLVDDRDRTV